jgi:hypothetical protein
MGAVMKRPVSTRYQWTKLLSATEDFMTEFSQRSSAGVAEALSAATAKFKETYSKQLTTVIMMTGAAMAPSLNKQATSDKHSYEKLVVRLLPRPSARSVAVGDIVAASEQQQLVSDDDKETVTIPAGNCWVLADNEELQPPDVIDSRSFGFLPYNSILGRVIYRLRSPEDYGAVVNSTAAFEDDEAVVYSEVDRDKLAENMPEA